MFFGCRHFFTRRRDSRSGSSFARSSGAFRAGISASSSFLAALSLVLASAWGSAAGQEPGASPGADVFGLAGRFLGRDVGAISIVPVVPVGPHDQPISFVGNRVHLGVRSRVTYGEYSIECNRASFNPEILEIEAEGDIIFRGPKMDIRANAIRYNFRHEEGEAYGVEGYHEPLYFRVLQNEVEKGAGFRRISKDQALLSGVSVTACDFPVPHYYIRGSEVILYPGDRIFIRHAVLYVWGVPVLYFPAYTRSLVEDPPWTFEIGHTRRLGGYMRIGYDYNHRTEVPDYFTPSKYRERTTGRARVKFDLFTRRGRGLGLDYKYSLNFGRHKGQLFLYGLGDEYRDVPNEDSTPRRGAVRWGHRSRLTDETLFQMDIDHVTDPDIYFDVLDYFEEPSQRRRPERRMRFAVTYARELYLGRIMLDLRDRVARNTFRDPSEPIANNLDYDPDPGGYRRGRIEGISGRRYAPASQKAPQFDLTSAYVKLWALPFHYDSSLSAFHALDTGLNPFLQDDDAWISGVDWRQGLTHRTRLSERLTWLNRIGLGVAYFERHTDRLRADLPPETVYPHQLDDLALVDRDTWLTGRRERSYRDVEEAFLYAEYQSRLNARLTNTLEGYLQYTLRDGTDDSLGEFYRRIGQRTAQTDIYQFPVKTHMLEAYLNHFLLYPNLTTYLRGGTNLHQSRNIAPYDLLHYAGVGTSYANPSREWSVSGGVDFQERQIRDLSDPDEFQQGSLVYSATAQYIPRHKRWWARLSVFAIQMLDHDPVAVPSNERNRFDENRTDVSVSPLVGRRLGPKYSAELAANYNTRVDDWKSAHLILKRDLHDLEASVQVGMRRVEQVRNNRLEAKRENEVRFNIRIKSPRTESDDSNLGAIRTLVDRSMQPEFAD